VPHLARRPFLGLILLALSCVRAPASPPSRSYALEEAPPELAALAQRGMDATQALQQRLGGRLQEELERGGPVAATAICQGEAQPLTHAVAQEQEISLGRTSHRLRNPNNAPRAWAAPQVRQSAGQRADQVKPQVYDLGSSVGLLRPIPTGAVCTRCHGDPATFAPELQAVLAAGYPKDQATGFTEGELRGYFWVEIPKAR
jgi:hypothetical protein